VKHFHGLNRLLVASFTALSALRPALRSGLSVPGATPPLAGAPGLDAPAVQRVSRRLRRSLSASVAEGMVTEVFSACTAGAVLTAWALYLHLGPLGIATLTALPYLSQLIQVPAAWLTASVGCRRVALVSVCVSRLVFVVLATLPLFPASEPTQRLLLVSVAATSALLGVVANNAWVAWMGELVPQRMRGRYFGRRTALCAMAGTASALAAGAALDAARSLHRASAVLSLLALCACAAGVVTTLLMSRQHAPAVRHSPLDRLAFLRPYRDRILRPLLAYQVAWNIACGLASAFYAVHMLKNLMLGFLLVALYNAGVNAVRVLAAPFWGRMLDRLGARPVLVVCSIGLTPLPLLWLLPRELRLLLLAIDLSVYGFLWAGHSLAVFSLPLAVTPREGRPYYLAALSTAGGLAFAMSASLGGALAHLLPVQLTVRGETFYGLQALFVLSAFIRAMAASLALRVVEPSAKPAQLIWRGVAEGVRAFTERRMVWAPARIRRRRFLG
jgi:MFS family permease